MKQWDYEKNELNPQKTAAKTHKPAWWLCERGHSWDAMIKNRVLTDCGCPYCTNKKVLPGFNDLSTTEPRIANEWNYQKNGDLTPEMFMRHSKSVVWWRCEKGHEWDMSITHRSVGYNCPICSNKRVHAGYNDLLTPATRAAIIEKLVKSGFAERAKKNLLPTVKGKTLVAVLPDTLTSAKLTAIWEHKLKQIEKGELDGGVFMTDIATFITAIVRDNNAPKPEFAALFPDTKKSTSESLGLCPRCGSSVREGTKGFFCDSRTCGFKLWRESKFWTAKKKPLTAAIVKVLLKDGRVALKGLFSEKTGRKYDAVVVLDDSGNGFVNFKIDFGK